MNNSIITNEFTKDIVDAFTTNSKKFINYLDEKKDISNLTTEFLKNHNFPLKLYCIPKSLKETFENGHFHRNYQYYHTILSIGSLYKDKNYIQFKKFIDNLAKNMTLINDLYNRKIIDKNNPNSILNFIIIAYYHYKKMYKVHNQTYDSKFLKYFNHVGGDVFNLFFYNLFGNQEDMEFLSLFFIFAEWSGTEIDNLTLLHRYYNYQVKQNIYNGNLNEDGISFIYYVKYYIKLIFSHNYKNHTISHKDIKEIISSLNKWCDEYAMYTLWDNDLSINLNFKFNKPEIIESLRNFMLSDYSIVFHGFNYIAYHYYAIDNSEIKNQLLLANERDLIKIADIVADFSHFFEIFKQKKLYHNDIKTILSYILQHCISKFNIKLLSIYMKNFSNSKNEIDNLQNEFTDKLSVSIKDLYDEYFGKLKDYSKINITDNELQDCHNKLLKMLNDQCENIELSSDERNIYNRFVDFWDKDKKNPKINTFESIKYMKEALSDFKKDESDLMIFTQKAMKNNCIKELAEKNNFKDDRKNFSMFLCLLVNYYKFCIIPYIENNNITVKKDEHFEFYSSNMLKLFNINIIKNKADMDFLISFFVFISKNNIRIDNIFNFDRYCENTNNTHNKTIESILNYIKFVFQKFPSKKLVNNNNDNNNDNDIVINAINNSDNIHIINDIIYMLNKLCDKNIYINSNIVDSYNNVYIKSFIFDKSNIIFNILDWILFECRVINNYSIKNKLFYVNQRKFIKIIDIAHKFSYFFKNQLFNCEKLEIQLSQILKNCIDHLNMKLLSIISQKNFIKSKSEIPDFNNELIDELHGEIKNLYDNYFDKFDSYNKNDSLDNEIKDCNDKLLTILENNKYKIIELSHNEKNIYSEFLNFHKQN